MTLHGLRKTFTYYKYMQIHAKVFVMITSAIFDKIWRNFSIDRLLFHISCTTLAKFC